MTTKEKLDAHAVGKMRDLLKRINNPVFAHFGPTPPAWDRTIPDKVDSMTDEDIVRVFNEVQSAPPEPTPAGGLSDFLLDVCRRADDMRRGAALCRGLLMSRGTPRLWLGEAMHELTAQLTYRLSGVECTPGEEVELMADARAAAANVLHYEWRAEGRLAEGLTEADALAVARFMVDPALLPAYVVRVSHPPTGEVDENKVFVGHGGMREGLSGLLEKMAEEAEDNGYDETAEELRALSVAVGFGTFGPGESRQVAGLDFRVMTVKETSWALPPRGVQNAQ